MAKIGYIGLGIMGSAIARNLMKAGHELVVHNRSQKIIAELVSEGAKAATSPKEVAAQVDFVFTNLPDSVRVEAFVPQAELLSDFSLVVHHGGSGTTMGAAQHGLVQLMLPQGADQFGNAEAVSAFGAGQSLIGPDVTADSVEQAARTLLTSTAARDAAHGLAQEVAAMPSVKAVAGDIASWSVPSRP